MSLRGKIDRLQKTMQGNLDYFELRDGSRYYFDPEEASKVTFLYFAESMDADYRREVRPEPPELLKAVGNARDRRSALDRVMDGYSHLPLNLDALIERGEFLPRSLVAKAVFPHGEGRA